VQIQRGNCFLIAGIRVRTDGVSDDIRSNNVFCSGNLIVNDTESIVSYSMMGLSGNLRGR
jgi:hypothetical protein